MPLARRRRWLRSKRCGCQGPDAGRAALREHGAAADGMIASAIVHDRNPRLFTAQSAYPQIPGRNCPDFTLVLAVSVVRPTGSRLAKASPYRAPMDHPHVAASVAMCRETSACEERRGNELAMVTFQRLPLPRPITADVPR